MPAARLRAHNLIALAFGLALASACGAPDSGTPASAPIAADQAVVFSQATADPTGTPTPQPTLEPMRSDVKVTPLPANGGSASTAGQPALTPVFTPIPPVPTPTLQPQARQAATANAGTATAAARSAIASATAQPAQTILIQNFAFLPATLTVTAGTTVIWRNMDAATHQIAGGDFDSGFIFEGQYWSTRIERAGHYSYYCNFHPTMRGTIVVTPSSQAPQVSS